MEETLDLLAARAFEKNLDLVYQMDDEIPAMVEGDALRLRQVLVNLLSNAIKFTEDGEIFVQVKLLSSQSGGSDRTTRCCTCIFPCATRASAFQPDRLARLFKPFMQAEASTAHRYGGTGLGLAISKQLVELMGGKMWAESVPGEGSTFHFTINVLAEPQPAPFALAGRQAKLADLRVLIVDDNATSRRVLAEQATKWGMIPRSAGDAQQAHEFAPRRRTSLIWRFSMRKCPAWTVWLWPRKFTSCPAAAMMPLVLLTPLGRAPGSARADAHPVSRTPSPNPSNPRNFVETLERALFRSRIRARPGAAPVQAKTNCLPSRCHCASCCATTTPSTRRSPCAFLQQLGYEPDLADQRPGSARRA